MLRGSLELAAAGAALARPNMADAAATTVETWWNQGFFPEKDVAFRALVADYERASGSKIDYALVPNSSTRLNGKRDRQGDLLNSRRAFDATHPCHLQSARPDDRDRNQAWRRSDETEVSMAKFERIIPILVYEDIPSAHDFLVDAFGFVSGGVQRTPDGEAVHGEVRAGDLLIWLHRAAPEHNLASPRSQSVATGGLVVHTNDVDAHYANARERGASVESEPKDQPYGQREYGARDPEGHRWWFASPLK